MNSGELHAFNFERKKPVRMSWRDGQITALTEVAQKPEKEIHIAPPLFDLQINGYAGVDFQQDDVSAEDLLRAVRALRRDGCARFFLTLVTAEWERMLSRLERYSALRRDHAELGDAIAGFHIEGPFLSTKPGFHGAHDPSLMLEPKPQHIGQLRSIAEGVPILLTMAPEVQGALAAIDLAVSAGMIVSLGHTDASYETLAAAVKAGADGFTHLGNGCPRELDRHDNIIWRVAALQKLMNISLIPDGIHIPPMLFRLLKGFLLSSRLVYLTTDAMAAAGAPPGRYRLGALELEVGEDRVVRQPGQTNFAGSALRPIEGVVRAERMVGWPRLSCWSAMSMYPADFVGVKNSIEVGGPATFCSVEPTEEGLRVNCCWRGEWSSPEESTAVG